MSMERTWEKFLLQKAKWKMRSVDPLKSIMTLTQALIIQSYFFKMAISISNAQKLLKLRK